MSSYVDRLLSNSCCVHKSCLHSAIRGFRNGVVYGARIRFPHALLMTILFRGGSVYDKAADILKLTYIHSRNLGVFALVYKLMQCALRRTRDVDDWANAFVAGAVGGALVFSDGASVINQQVNMYIMSRVIIGTTRLLASRGYIRDFGGSYTLYAALMWAAVMALFEFDGGVLQRSLQQSMQYIYKDSDNAKHAADEHDIMNALFSE